MALKRLAKRVILAWSVTRWLLQWLARGHCPIFMYHRFGNGSWHSGISRDVWCAQLDELQRSFHVLTLEELCRQRREGRRDWRGTCAITVDDGYRDFYEIAYPELKRRGLPATLFVTTGFLRLGAWLWWDVVRYVIDHTARKSAQITYSGGALALSLGTEDGKHSSWARVGTACCQVSTTEKWGIIRSLSRELHVSVPDQPPKNYQGCTRTQLITMAEHRITFGPHSVTHPILTRCETHEWQDEIMKSHDDLCTLKKGYVPIFAFPNGMRADYSDSIVQFVETQGLEAAVVGHYDDFQHETQFSLRRCIGSSDFVEFQWKLWGGEYVWTRFKAFAQSILRWSKKDFRTDNDQSGKASIAVLELGPIAQSDAKLAGATTKPLESRERG